LYFDTRLNVIVVVGAISWHAHAESNEDRQEGKTRFAEVEVVHADVDQREGFEEGVEDAVNEGCVYSCESLSLLQLAGIILREGWDKRTTAGRAG
jgi:hypothetical protein